MVEENEEKEEEGIRKFCDKLTDFPTQYNLKTENTPSQRSAGIGSIFNQARRLNMQFFTKFTITHNNL